MPKIPGGSEILESVFTSFKKGTIKKADYETFNKVYDPIMDNKQEAMDALRESATRQKYLASMGAAKFDELGSRMDDQAKGNTFMANLISPAFKSNSSEINIDMRKQSIQNLLKADTVELDEALSTRLTKLLGFDEQAQDSFIAAVLDPNAQVNPKYRRMAQSWEKANKQALKMHTAAGGDIGEIQGIGFLPQTHDTMRMMEFKGAGKSKAKNKASRLIEDAAAAKDQWVNFTKKQIDYDKMNLTGKSQKEILDILSEIYETITSGGLNKVKKALSERIAVLKEYDAAVKSGKKAQAKALKEKHKIKNGEKVADLYKDFEVNPMMANQRAKHREIHYTVDGWKQYQKRFGEKDIYKTVSDYLDGMSMDIASMQVLGPNPVKTFEKLKSKAANEGKLSGSQEHLQGMFDVATGVTDKSKAITDFELGLESVGGGFRSLGVASDLGGAAISSLTDPVMSAVTAGHMGRSPIGTLVSQMGTIVRMMAAGMKVSEKQKFAQRIGIVQDAFMSSIRNNRFSEGGGNKNIQKVADGVLRMSGLIAWTNALRTSFALEMSGFLGDNIGKQLKDFEFGKQLMDVYGLTQADWNKLTKADLTSFEKGGFLDTTKLYMREPDLALRLMDIINQETHYAVIMPDSRVRSVTTGGGAAKGTVKGELARSVWMYKSFPIAMISVHVGRMLGVNSVAGKLAYGGSMAVGLTVVGSVVVQMKDVMKGKEPMPMDDGEAWAKLLARGFMQGGGAGIFGDLFLSDATRYGGGMVSTVLGKVTQPLDDIDTLKKLYQGDDVKFSDIKSAMARLGSNYVPGRNLWYTRLLYERIIKDNMMKLVDPDYDKRLRKHMRKMNKETGQGYWSVPGSI